MARVRLGRRDVREHALPAVCMRCGVAATLERRKTFSWHPPWVYLLILVGVIPFAIVAAILTQKRRVFVPLCERHRNHFLWRRLIIFGGFFLVLALVVLAIFISAQAERNRNVDQVMTGLFCFCVPAVLLVWLIAGAIGQMTAIRPEEITERSITLTGVSEEFIAALEAADAEEYEDDDRPVIKADNRDSTAFRDPERRRKPRPIENDFEDE